MDLNGASHRLNPAHSAACAGFPNAGRERPWNAAESLTIVQTGVTAMTRAFISAVARSGNMLHPVGETAPPTAQADPAPTSSEVSFLESCRCPFKDRMRFCSPLRFFDILRQMYVDAIRGPVWRYTTGLRAISTPPTCGTSAGNQAKSGDAVPRIKAGTR